MTVSYTGTTNDGTAYNSTVAPTAAGTYTASATYTGSNVYLGSSDSKGFSIGKAPSTTTVTCPVGVLYTGSPLTPCSVTVTSVNLSLTPTPVYTNNTAEGTATASYTYSGDGNHAGSSGTRNFIIFRTYTFVPVSFPASGNQGSVFPVSWKYTVNGVTMDTSSLMPVFRAVELSSCNGGGEVPGSVFDNMFAPGNSNFQYATATFTWKYNWQTKLFKKGVCYNIYIVTNSSAGVFIQINGPFKIKLN